MEIQYNLYYGERIIIVKDKNYCAVITVPTGSFIPFDYLQAATDNDKITVHLKPARYGAFITINDVESYYVGYKDINIDTNQIVETVKKGFDEIKNYITTIISKGRPVNKKPQ